MNTQADIKTAVVAAFSAAADTYEAGADVQREVAGRVARRIKALSLRARPRILEIGCGTGFLSRALAEMNPTELVLTDISSTMLERCRRTVQAPARFLVMDGEEPSAEAGGDFDLICSSLAFQWFINLPVALARLGMLLAPGGHLAFATLAAGSFAEWREAHGTLGVQPAARSYPALGALKSMFPEHGVGNFAEERLTRRYADGHAFLDHLRRIGAQSPEGSRRPLGAGALRRVLRRFETGIDVTYHIAYGTWERAR